MESDEDVSVCSPLRSIELASLNQMFLRRLKDDFRENAPRFELVVGLLDGNCDSVLRGERGGE
jgi:hypothetical protein